MEQGLKSSYRLNLASGSAIAAEVIDSTANGTLTSFSGTLANKLSIPGSIEMTATVGAAVVTITDNGEGVLSGDGVTGTINYTTGAWTLEFDTAPDDTTDITADYTRLVDPVNAVADENLGSPLALGSTNAYSDSLRFTTELANNNIIPNTFSADLNFSSSAVTITDDGRGNLTGDNISFGTINYNTGEIVLRFTIDPDSGADLVADYSYVNDSPSVHQLVKDIQGKYVVIVENENETGDVSVVLSRSTDRENWSELTSTSVPVGQSRSVTIAGKIDYLRVHGEGGKANIRFIQA